MSGKQSYGIESCEHRFGPQTGMHVFSVINGDKPYVFRSRVEDFQTLMKRVAECAADKTTSFNWANAAVVSQSVRRVKEQMALDRKEYIASLM